MEKEYYTEVEALEDIRAFIIDNYDSYEHYEDLHHNVFNFGYRGGLEALEKYGVFEAIGEVQQYETDNFETVFTDLSNADSVSNMLWYIVGENVVYSLDTLSSCVGLMNEEDNKEIIKEIDERLDDLA